MRGFARTHKYRHPGIFERKQKSTDVCACVRVLVASVFGIYLDTLSVSHAPASTDSQTYWNWKRFVIWTIKWYKIGFDSSLFWLLYSLLYLPLSLSCLQFSFDHSSPIYFLSIFVCLLFLAFSSIFFLYLLLIAQCTHSTRLYSMMLDHSKYWRKLIVK